MEGTVKWYNERKGYGFVAGDDGDDYFVHVSELPEGTLLNEGDKIYFESKETDKGKQCKNINMV